MSVFDMGKNIEPEEFIPIPMLPSTVGFKEYEEWYWREIAKARPVLGLRVVVDGNQKEPIKLVNRPRLFVMEKDA